MVDAPASMGTTVRSAGRSRLSLLGRGRSFLKMTLTSSQHEIVSRMARLVPLEKRELYLQRINAMLRGRGRFNDADVMEIAMLALTGLAPRPAA